MKMISYKDLWGLPCHFLTVCIYRQAKSPFEYSGVRPMKAVMAQAIGANECRHAYQLPHLGKSREHAGTRVRVFLPADCGWRTHELSAAGALQSQSSKFAQPAPEHVCIPPCWETIKVGAPPSHCSSQAEGCRHTLPPWLLVRMV